jgi:hypothetical protein
MQYFLPENITKNHSGTSEKFLMTAGKPSMSKDQYNNIIINNFD